MGDTKYKVGLIEFKTKDDAKMVLNSLIDIIDKYEFATVADFYDLVDYKSASYEHNLYGWTSGKFLFKNSKIERMYDNQYVLKLPDAIEINKPTRVNPNSYESEDQMVSHPPHYKSKSGLETIQIIEAVTEDLLGIEAWDTGNVVKYISRWKKKNGLQDLEKAMWYLTDLINHVKEKENE